MIVFHIAWKWLVLLYNDLNRRIAFCFLSGSAVIVPSGRWFTQKNIEDFISALAVELVMVTYGAYMYSRFLRCEVKNRTQRPELLSTSVVPIMRSQSMFVRLESRGIEPLRNSGPFRQLCLAVSIHE